MTTDEEDGLYGEYGTTLDDMTEEYMKYTIIWYDKKVEKLEIACKDARDMVNIWSDTADKLQRQVFDLTNKLLEYTNKPESV